MNDQELADAAYEVLKDGAKPAKHKCGHHSWPVYTWGLDAEHYVRDWRVAGALMEKALKETPYIERTFENALCDSSKSLPRAVIEACVEALAAVDKADVPCPRTGTDAHNHPANPCPICNGTGSVDKGDT